GYLTLGGVPLSVIDAFRADPRARQWVLDEWASLKSTLGPNDLAMEFTILGDYWSAQVNPLGPHEQEQLAIDSLAVGAAAPAPLAPEPAGIGAIVVAVGAFLGRG